MILSPIARIPQANLLPFYRRCLELNGMMTIGALGVHHDVLFVIQRRFLLGIDPIGLAAEFDAVTEAADAVDDMVMQEFGARPVGQVDFDWFAEVV